MPRCRGRWAALRDRVAGAVARAHAAGGPQALPRSATVVLLDQLTDRAPCRIIPVGLANVTALRLAGGRPIGDVQPPAGLPGLGAPNQVSWGTNEKVLADVLCRSPDIWLRVATLRSQRKDHDQPVSCEAKPVRGLACMEVRRETLTGRLGAEAGSSPLVGPPSGPRTRLERAGAPGPRCCSLRWPAIAGERSAASDIQC